MFFFSCPIFFYPIRPNATIIIGYTKPYGYLSQSNLLSRYIQMITPYQSNALLIKNLSHHGQQQLYLQYKVPWILNKVVGALAFSQSYLRMPTPRQFHQKSVPPLRLFLSSIFHSYLFIKLPLHSSLTLPSSISQQFLTSLFLRIVIRIICIKNFGHLANPGCIKRSRNLVRTDTVLTSLFYPKVYTGITGLTIIDSYWFLIRMETHPTHILLYPQPIVISSIPY